MWHKSNPVSDYKKPRKPDWSIKRNGVECSVWAQLNRSHPHFRTKLSVVRRSSDDSFPYERVQLLISPANGELDEDNLATALILLQAAHRWIETKKLELSSTLQVKQLKSERRKARRVIQKKIPKFEPISH